MRLILKLTIRGIQRRPLRTFLSLLGIMIGVAGILALGITNQASIQSISELFAESSGRSDLMITSASGAQPLNSGDLRSIIDINDVQHALPVVKVQTALAGDTSTDALSLSFFGVDSGGLEIQGVDPGLEPLARDYKITEGRFLNMTLDVYEIVFVENYAADQDINPGDRIRIVTPNGIETLKVVGLMAKEGPGKTNNGTFAIIPIESAQRMFNRVGEYDQIDLILTENTRSREIEELRIGIQDRLGEGFSVTYPAGQGQRMTQMLSNYQIGLNMLSMIALFVGAFLIYNAFAMTIVERTREFGMLRTIGMSRRQIVTNVIMEALALGVIGSGLGALLGILGARGLAGLMGSLLGAELTIGVTIPLNTLLLSLGVGISVTIISALIPSIQAGRVSPIAALRVRGKAKEGWILRSGWKIGLGMLILATGLLIWNPFPYDPQFTLGSLTVIMMFGGITLVIPATVSIWEKLSRPIMRLIYGSSGTIGSRNIERSKVRTTLTVAALLVGVAMIVVVRLMTAAFSTDIIEWIDAYLGGDIYVYSSIPLRASLPQQLSGLTGVVSATPIYYQNAEFTDGVLALEEITFMAVDPPSYLRVTNFVFSDSSADQNSALSKLNEGGAVLISSVISEKYGLVAGDNIWLKTRSGLTSFEVAEVVVDFYNRGLVVTGNRHDLRRFFRTDSVSMVLLKVDDGARVSDVITAIDEVYGKRYRLSMESNTSIRETVATLMNTAFSLFDVMGVLSVMVASLGVVNTLTMNIMERTQEIGMLRAIGMTRSQVIKMVLAEAGLMGVIGGLVGLVFGILLSRIFLAGMSAMSGYSLEFSVPIEAVILGLIVALVVSQIAAIQPARRAARTNVLEAIHYE
jgi:putative ABC transport system permease protein